MIEVVLADTGIWIDYLHGHASVSELQNLLDENLVCTHKWIEGELRSGSLKNRDQFFDSFTKLSFIPTVTETLLFRLIESEKLFGKGLSIIDIHLYASAKAEGIKIWTKDKNLSDLCKKSKLLYERN